MAAEVMQQFNYVQMRGRSASDFDWYSGSSHCICNRLARRAGLMNLSEGAHPNCL